MNMGTRFVATQEAPVHENVKQALVNHGERDTRLIMRTLRNTERALHNPTVDKVLDIESKGDTKIEDIAPFVSGLVGKEMLEDGDMGDDQGVNEKVILALILESSMLMLDQKWDLTRDATARDEKFKEVLDLIMDGVMPREMLPALFNENPEELSQIADTLNDRQGKLNLGKPYPLLKMCRKLPAETRTEKWLQEAMGTPMPPFEDFRVLVIGGKKKTGGEEQVHLDLARGGGEELGRSLVDLWLLGMDICWDLVYGSRGFRRAALPTYGFDGSSFRPTGAGETFGKRSSRDLSSNDPIIREHVIAGKPLLPGAAMVQFGLEAVRREVGETVTTLKNIVFKNPGVVARNTVVEISVFRDEKKFLLKTDSRVLCEGEYA